MGLFGNISEQKKERKETIKIFTEIVKNKEEIIKSLKKVSEISFKKPKGGKRIPSSAIRGTKNWEIMSNHYRNCRNKEIEGYINKLYDDFNIRIDEKYVDKIIRYVKRKEDFYDLEDTGLIFGKEKYLKTLRNLLDD
ncbi:MAG: hypothetical protein CMJ05_06495 [Pelagibacterales bacterium]|nr:hypothetical protein [Pelagibacterales bacterium]|tara:strand:- start:747 stop:1157 length:411 start_codon:yes stop_codon:yes gene_type:complete